MRLVIGTGNAGKLREFEAMLGPLGVEVLAAPAAYLAAPPDESGVTFAANARIKLEALMRCTDEAALTDDSGLCVQALDGAPGVRSARYASEVQDLPQDAANRRKLLTALQGVPQPQRGARFVAVLALRLPDCPVQMFEGACPGHIAVAEAGAGGFGYDPVFVPGGSTQTFAELPAAVKHSKSHRGAALVHLVAALRAQRVL